MLLIKNKAGIKIATVNVKTETTDGKEMNPTCLIKVHTDNKEDLEGIKIASIKIERELHMPVVDIDIMSKIFQEGIDEGRFDPTKDNLVKVPTATGEMELTLGPPEGEAKGKKPWWSD